MDAEIITHLTFEEIATILGGEEYAQQHLADIADADINWEVE